MKSVAQYLIAAGIAVFAAATPSVSPLDLDNPTSGGHVPIISVQGSYSPGADINVQVKMEYRDGSPEVTKIGVEARRTQFDPIPPNPSEHTIPGVPSGDTWKIYTLDNPGSPPNQTINHTIHTGLATTGAIHVRVVSYVGNTIVGWTPGLPILESPTFTISDGDLRIVGVQSDRVDGFKENIVAYLEWVNKPSIQGGFAIECSNKPFLGGEYPPKSVEGISGVPATKFSAKPARKMRVVIKTAATWTIVPVFLRLTWHEGTKRMVSMKQFKVLVGPWWK